MYWLRCCLGLLCFLWIGQLNVHAKETNPIISKNDQATIISEYDYYDGRSQILLGLRIDLKPGWHTYWKNPGDAGEPAHVSVLVDDQEIEQKPEIIWPSPTALSENGLMSYVYKGDTVLPFKVDIAKQEQDKPLHLKIKANWLVCADICIPEQGEFTLDLPKGNAVLSKEAQLLQSALQKQPQQSPWNIHVSPSGVLWLKSDHSDVGKISHVLFIPEKSDLLNQTAKQQLSVHQGLMTLQLPLLDQKSIQQPVSGVLVIEDHNHQVKNIQVDASISEVPHSQNSSSYSLFILIGSAFLGGILLNLMPCVFPVIAMKLLSLSRMGQEHISHRYKSSVAYTAGIICCFIAMALAFVGLRWMGSQLGWGFQFQSVGFVVLLCWLLFVISLNFLGVFNVQFSLNNTGAVGRPYSFSSDFFTGLLAVLVATPCTAPFMGIAIAGALNAPLWMSILIFIGMGLGLALPYILFACVPVFAKILPRPGLWMDILKQFLAFPLLLSCLWLAWVVYQHQQPMSFLVLLTGFIGVGFVAWGIGLIQQLYMQGTYRVFRLLMGIFIAIALLLLGGGFYLFVHDQPNQSIINLKKVAIPFSSQKLEELRKEHKPVFVNMTASWCLTCMVNDKVALSSEKVQKAFQNQHITYMVGDWTQYDQHIGDFLKAHGREGVPLYIYYPAEGEPKILPQILTPQIVIDYLFDPKAGR